MSSRYAVIYCALLLCLSLFTSGCKDEEEVDQTTNTNQSSESKDEFVESKEMIIWETDSDEWHIRLFKEHLLYANAVKVKLPKNWQLPTREDAQTLKTLTYPSEERFVTSDGYTFGMPSASVSKAGQKTKYSVLGLYKRSTTYDIGF